LADAGDRWGRPATDAQAMALWSRLDAAYVGFEHYRAITARRLSVVILQPR
jgi:hypothetical protein